MKVLLDRPDRLVLRDLHLGLGLALAAVVALPALMAWGYFRNGIMSGGIVLSVLSLILLIGCFGSFVRPILITFDRPGNVIEVVERSLFGRKRQAHVLRQFRGASVEAKVIRRKPGEMKDRRHRKAPPEPRAYRAVLVHQNGHHLPLTQIYGSEKAAGTAAAAINRWIGSDLMVQAG
ncbi:hypothetical protein [Neotabrizicola sp. sgz301269]|uniref:hypothetical protein n=1 Tax=Neotabrizicola sp. sgz301269 TaxID=3276282 RepID=UPI00376F5E32